MNMAPNHPSGHGGRRKRRRGRRGHAGNNRPGQAASSQQQAPQNTSTISQQGPPARRGSTFTGPMDHSYRSGQGSSQQGRGRGGFQSRQFVERHIEPLPTRPDENSIPRIFAFIDDLFFTAKVQETSRKLNVKVQFVKSDKDVLEQVNGNGGEQPSLIIFDLNNAAAKPLTTAPKLKSKLKKGTTIIGFLSHLQADLKAKAIEAGFDMVVPRSAFSQNLPSLLRRHAEDEGATEA